MTSISFIHHCLSLAENGRNRVGTNPFVGACLVRDGEIIAEGFHAGFGELHAERQLLLEIRNTQYAIRSSDVLYVNLEPCCHHGKTPPCTDIIIESGVQTVVYGMFDPNTEVAGKGIARLQEAGIECIGPIDPAVCRRFNRGYVSLREKGRPYITLKRAQTQDGRIANEDGSPMKITSQEQDVWSHTWLRAKHDAVLVGVETVVRDNPILDARLQDTRHPSTVLRTGKIQETKNYRIILDPHLRIPLDAQVVNGDLAHRAIIIVDANESNEPNEPTKTLLERGVTILPVTLDSSSHFHWEDLWSALLTPRENCAGITSILVEGGARTWDTFKNAGIVDEEVVLIH